MTNNIGPSKKVDHVSTPSVPEQQVSNDSTRVNEELSRGISGGNTLDLDKGVTIQKNPKIDASKLPSNEEVLAQQGVIREPDSALTRAWNNIKGTIGKDAKTILGILLSPLAGLTACTPDSGMEPVNPHAEVQVTNKMMADYVIDLLNNPEKLLEMEALSPEDREKLEQMNLSGETDDGLKFKYGYDYEKNTDNVKPYILIGDGENSVKLPVNLDKLQELSAENVVDYIHVIGEELSTKDGVHYDFGLNRGVAQVSFDNGLLHNVGTSVAIEPKSATATLYKMFEASGMKTPPAGSIAMDVKAEDGSYGNAAKGFEMRLATPQLLEDVTSGSPKVQGSFSGVSPAVFDENYNVIKDPEEVKLEFNGKAIAQEDGSIKIKNEDGSEILMKQEENFFDGSNTHEKCVVIYKKEGNEFVEQFVMTDMGNGGTEIGLIDRDHGTTLQHYPGEMISFDTQGAKDADSYYNQKQTNLNKAYGEANENYKFLDEWVYLAEADANAQITY